MAVGYKVVTLKGRPYAVHWFDLATGGERQQSLDTRDRAEAERLADEFAARLLNRRLHGTGKATENVN